MFLIFFVLAVGVRHANADIGPQCAASASSGQRLDIVKCTGSKYTLPLSINLTEARDYHRMKYLTIGGSRDAEVVITEEFQGFPDMPYLDAITMRGFKNASGESLSLKALLHRYMSSLATVVVEGGFLTTLQSSTFDGFNYLQSLTIRSTGLSHIDSLAFTGILYGGPLVVSLDDNQLVTLDMNVFYPVSTTLRKLSVKSNHLQEVTADDFLPQYNDWSFPRLNNLDLAHNKLTVLPQSLIDKISNQALEYLNLRNNSMCISDKFCTCCEMEPLMRWAANEHSLYSFDFSCGSAGPDGFGACLQGESFAADFTTGECQRDYSLSGSDVNPVQYDKCRSNGTVLASTS